MSPPSSVSEAISVMKTTASSKVSASTSPAAGIVLTMARSPLDAMEPARRPQAPHRPLTTGGTDDAELK